MPDAGAATAGALDQLADEGDFYVAGKTAYWQRYDEPGTAPDDWSAPVPVRSERFRRLLSSKMHPPPSPSSKKVKDAITLLEDAAFKQPKRREVSWSEMTDDTLRVVVAPHLVVRVDATGVYPERNGDHALFQLAGEVRALRWSDLTRAYDPRGAYRFDAFQALFADMPPPIPEDTNVVTDDHVALMLAFWIGVFVEDGCQGRPLLGLFGAYQSGKSSVARLLGKLYYGEDFEVAGSTVGGRSVKDLQATMAYDPFVVRDDMNSTAVDIADAMCAMATGSVLRMAQMHETLALAKFSTRASLCVTAHTPVWAMRADLLSRMLVVRISKPPPTPTTDKERQARAVSLRAAVWMETFVALHGAFALGGARWEHASRFEDWEMWVRRVAHVGGWHDRFHRAIVAQDGQRVRLACDTDAFLRALYATAQFMDETPDRYYSAMDIFDMVTMRMSGAHVNPSDPSTRPSVRALAAPKALSRFLAQLEREGTTVAEVMRGPVVDGAATWRLVAKR